MKRFWKSATAVLAETGHTITLDDRLLRSPRRRPLIVPSLALAEAIAAEWEAQGETVDPTTMPLNRLANSVVDLMPERRTAALEQVQAYAGTDLLCYRGAEPPALVDLYHRHWDPPLAWLDRHHRISFTVIEGLMPRPQPAAALVGVADLVAGLDDWRLVGTHAVATATGSVVLALMVEAGALEGRAAADAALIEERFQRARWGEEAEALAREARLVADVMAADQYLRTLA